MRTSEAEIYVVLLIAFVVLGIIIAYYIYSIVNAHRGEAERKKQYMLYEMNILERERERIAHNLHDSAGPVLSFLKLELDSFETTHEPDQKKILKIKQQIDNIIADLRQTSHNLMPTALMNYGLVAALSELCKNMSKPTLKIEFIPDWTHPIVQNMAIHLYRIIEEIIYNTIKHAEASKLRIVIMERRGKLTIVTRDNGKGFDLGKVENSKLGLGLKGFEYRTELLGGVYSIHAEVGKGVEIIITIPIKS